MYEFQTGRSDLSRDDASTQYVTAIVLCCGINDTDVRVPIPFASPFFAFCSCGNVAAARTTTKAGTGNENIRRNRRCRPAKLVFSPRREQHAATRWPDRTKNDDKQSRCMYANTLSSSTAYCKVPYVDMHSATFVVGYV